MFRYYLTMVRNQNTSVSGFEESLDQLVAGHLGSTAPAIQLVAVRDGDPVIARSWGPAASEPDHPDVTMDSVFDFASLTKLFTTTAFLALASRELVAVDDPVSSVIPEFGERSPRLIDVAMDPHTEEPLILAEDAFGEAIDPHTITFRHLLTHSSGLPPWINLFRLYPHDSTVAADVRRQAVITAIARSSFADRVSRAVHYSDLGFILLGEAVAQLHGKPLDEAIADLVTAPLGLDSIMFEPLKRGVPVEQIMPTELDLRWRQRRCWGEVHDENAFGSGGVSGHAGLFGNAADLAKFGQAWLERSPVLGIPPDLHREAITEQFSHGGARRGLGWMLKPAEAATCGDKVSENAYGHTGFTGTSLWIDPDQQLVVALLTNRVYYGRDPDGISALRPAVHDPLAGSVSSTAR